MSVTLGPCPGLADRCPRHKTNSSSTHGALVGSPSGWPWQYIWHGNSTESPPSPRQQGKHGILPTGTALYPKGRLGAWESRPELDSSVGAEWRETPDHCYHPDSRASQVQISSDQEHLPLPLTVIPLPVPNTRLVACSLLSSEIHVHRQPSTRGSASQGFPSSHPGSDCTPLSHPSHLSGTLHPEHQFQMSQCARGGEEPGKIPSPVASGITSA